MKLTVTWRYLIRACEPMYIIVWKEKEMEYLCWKFTRQIVKFICPDDKAPGNGAALF
jgi:hypothetical protein